MIPTPRGMWQALRQTYRSHGVKGLWRGVEGAVPRLTVGWVIPSDVCYAL